jgi:superfamily II DNA or RNA helicase
MLYVQIIGRALRTAPGKDHALILDHSDTTMRLGFVTDIFHDHLNDGKDKPKVERKAPLPKECPQCENLKTTKVCPNCGFESKPPVSQLKEDDRDLVEITAGGKRSAKRVWSMEEKTDFYAQLLGYCRLKGYSEGWAAHKYKEKFEVWPKGVRAAPKTPNLEVSSWIKSRQIAWARSKRRAEAGNVQA